MKRSFLNRMRCHNLDEVSARGCVIPDLKSCLVICVWSNSTVEEPQVGKARFYLSVLYLPACFKDGMKKREGEGRGTQKS
jgi:hypothetical protein